MVGVKPPAVRVAQGPPPPQGVEVEVAVPVRRVGRGKAPGGQGRAGATAAAGRGRGAGRRGEGWGGRRGGARHRGIGRRHRVAAELQDQFGKGVMQDAHGVDRHGGVIEGAGIDRVAVVPPDHRVPGQAQAEGVTRHW